MLEIKPIFGIPFFFIIVIAIILIMIGLPIVRTIRLRKTARLFHLNFKKTKRKAIEEINFRETNFISGTLNGSTVEIYDHYNPEPKDGGNKGYSVVLINSKMKKIRRKFWGVASVPTIVGILHKINNSNSL